MKTSIPLINGRYFDYLSPDPSAIDLEVLEHGLSIRVSATIRPITTTEHSLRVRRIAAELRAHDTSFAGACLSNDTELWALLYNAHEALVPWGYCFSPGKTDEMRAIEDRIDGEILTALGIEFVNPVSVAKTVKVADEIAMYFESMLWGPGATSVWPSTYEITGGGEHPRPSRGQLIERFMPLIVPRPDEHWRTEVEQLLRNLEI